MKRIQVAQVVRLLAPWTDEWRVAGREVWDGSGRQVCRCQDTTLAEVICRIHNLFLPLVNYTIMLDRKLADLKGLKNDD